MTRPQPSAAPPLAPRPLALSWLLVLAILAGMGLSPGAHCLDGMVVAPVSSAWAAGVGAPAPASSASAAGVGAPAPVLAVEAGECEVVRAATVRTGVGARVPLPSAGRTLAVTSPPQPVRTRLVPAVALATIGVCRT